jgi:hypothetical protein
MTMSLFLLLIARFLTANGVPAVVCGDDLVIGAKCPGAPVAPPPPLSPPDGTTVGSKSVPFDPKSISNGF